MRPPQVGKSLAEYHHPNMRKTLLGESISPLLDAFAREKSHFLRDLCAFV